MSECVKKEITIKYIIDVPADETIELKPCPFCNGEAYYRTRNTSTEQRLTE